MVGPTSLRFTPIEEFGQQLNGAIGGIGSIAHFAVKLDDIGPRQISEFTIRPSGKKMQLGDAAVFLTRPLFPLRIDMVLQEIFEYAPKLSPVLALRRSAAGSFPVTASPRIASGLGASLLDR